MPNAVFRLLVALLVAGSTAGVAARQQSSHGGSPQPPVPPPAAGQLQPAPLPALQAESFSEWLADFRKEAISRGISAKVLDEALVGVEPLPVVIERDRTQAEQTLTLDQYLKRRLDRKTVKMAREMARRHAALLARISAAYSVPANVIVAVWGLESNFGRFSGVRPTMAALATLAYDNRRSAMFRNELVDALRIVERGDIEPSRMKGSWAGAMGQPQFMPSSYLRYAEDFDHDGRRDIWSSTADVFASIANYLKQNGWRTSLAWGRAVKLPKHGEEKLREAVPLRTEGCEAVRQMSEARPLSRWRALGVRPEGRRPLPRPDTLASLVRAGSTSYLAFDNYGVLLQYNCAHAYALAVALLSEKVKPVKPGRAEKGSAKTGAKAKTPKRR